MKTTSLTNEEIVLLVNLLMPVAMKLRKEHPHGDFPETTLLGKLIEMRKELVG